MITTPYSEEFLKSLVEEPVPGIYFNLPEDWYHKIPALGSTGVKKLAIDPCEFQFDRLYGEDVDSKAKLFGNALHARVLEGRRAYEDRFFVNVPPNIPEDALRTVDDFKEFLTELGQSGLSKLNKPGLIKLVRELDPAKAIADDIIAEHKALNEGKHELDAKLYRQVQLAAEWLSRDPLIGDSMEDGAFIEGAPEVSIIVDDNGVLIKCRLDRMLRTGIIDLKSYAPMFDEPLTQSFEKTVKRLHYKVQAAHYRRIWHMAKDLYLEGDMPVVDPEPYDGFLKDCFNAEEPAWFWLAVKRKGAPSPFVTKWVGKIDYQNAWNDVERAIDTYRALRDEFGVDSDWIINRGVHEMGDDSYYQ